MSRVTLDWAGKQKPDPVMLRKRVRVVDAHPYWTSEIVREGRLLLRGDALASAAWLEQFIGGCVDLIYLDPPFAVGSDFLTTRLPGAEPQFAYSDRWKTDEEYLQFLYGLICLSHRLLSEQGSIYLHVDRRTSHWARCLLAEVFGAENERGVLVWDLGNGSKSRREWGCTHNDILCFSKGSTFRFHPDRAALREPHARASLETHFRRTDDQGRRYRDRQVNGKVYRYFADEGRLVGSVWKDCPSMVARSPIMNEATGYPTQKPERLLERIIEASSEPGDLVVDLCCGSGTTLAVASRTGRRWIGADLGRYSIELSRARVESPGAAGEVKIVDLVPVAPKAPWRLASMLGMDNAVETVRNGICGTIAGRKVAVWPHGVVVDDEMISNQTNRTRDATVFACAFQLREKPHEGLKVLRYLPETLLAASLRNVYFSEVFSRHGEKYGSVLRIDIGPSEGPVWIRLPLESKHIRAWWRVEPDGTVSYGGTGVPAPGDGGGRAIRMLDVFGFEHTLMPEDREWIHEQVCNGAEK